MNPIVTRVLIIFGVIVGVLLVGSLVYNYFFGPGTLLVSVKQEKTQLTIDNEKPVEVTNSTSFKLNAGKHHLKASKYGYEDQQADIEIESNKLTEVNINLTALVVPQNVSTNTINFDQQLRSQIDPSKYVINKVQYFENNTWAVVFMSLNVPQTQSMVSILKYNFDTKKWDQPIPAGEVYDNSITAIVPGSVYDYLVANRKILKTKNPWRNYYSYSSF